MRFISIRGHTCNMSDALLFFLLFLTDALLGITIFLVVWRLGNAAVTVAEHLRDPDVSASVRLAEMETALAALTREVSDVDDKAEARFRRLNQRSKRAEAEEEDDDAEAERLAAQFRGDGSRLGPPRRRMRRATGRRKRG